jgi:hypothetical protein
MVPQASSNGSQRLSITLDGQPFETILEMIYKAVGCSDVKRKPNLSYKLSTAPQKNSPISLATEDDWRGCLEDTMAAELKLNKAARSSSASSWQSATITIIVSEDVSAFI